LPVSRKSYREFLYW